MVVGQAHHQSDLGAVVVDAENATGDLRAGADHDLVGAASAKRKLARARNRPRERVFRAAELERAGVHLDGSGAAIVEIDEADAVAADLLQRPGIQERCRARPSRNPEIASNVEDTG